MPAQFHLVVANLISGLLIELAPMSSRHRSGRVVGCLRVESFTSVSRRSGRRSNRPACASSVGRRRGDWVALEADGDGLAMTLATTPPGHLIARTSCWRSACSCRASCCRSRCACPGGRFESARGVSRALFWLQRNGSLVIGAGLAITGSLLVVALGTQLLAQPWLLLALALYAANLLLAFFIQRPGLARLLRLQPGESEEARRRWRDWARRQRYFSYVMAGLIGVIAFLMITKPNL